MEEDDLIGLHFGLGMAIRNEWLYAEGGEVLLEDCERRAGKDPSYLRDRDSASSVILKRTWELAREEK